jgi:hypothetical protein
MGAGPGPVILALFLSFHLASTQLSDGGPPSGIFELILTITSKLNDHILLMQCSEKETKTI